MAEFFETTSARDLSTQLITAAEQELGTALLPGDERRVWCDVLAYLAIVFGAHANELADEQTIDGAHGETLDALAARLGLTRSEGVKATVRMLYTAEAQGIAYTLPTRYAAQGLTFIVPATTMPANQDSITLTAEAEAVGAQYNGIPSGTDFVPVDPPDSFISCASIIISMGGGDDETDDDEAFRARVNEARLTPETAGTIASYRAVLRRAFGDLIDLWAETTDEGVRFFPLFRDAVTGHGRVLTAAELALVEEYLTRDDVRALGDRPIVDNPQKAYRSFTAVCHADAERRSAFEAAVGAVIAEWRLWQCSALGRAFNRQKLTAALLDAGAYRVEYIVEDAIGTSDYFEAAANEFWDVIVTREVVD